MSRSGKEELEQSRKEEDATRLKGEEETGSDRPHRCRLSIRPPRETRSCFIQLGYYQNLRRWVT